MSGAISRIGVWARQDFWDRLGAALGSRNMWLGIAAVEAVFTLFSQMPTDTRRPVLNLTAGVISSTAVLAVIGCGWFLLLRQMTGIARVAAAVPILVLAGVARGVVLQSVLVGWDMSQPTIEGYKYRIAAGILNVLVGGFTCAAAKVALDGQRARLEKLLAEQNRLAQVLHETEADLHSDQSGAIATISSYLADQLGELRSSSPVLAIDSLDQLASSVVRPLSHELASATPTWQAPEPSTVQQRIDWSAAWGSMASIGFINLWGPPIVTLIVTPGSVFALGAEIALVSHLAVAVLLYLGLWTLRKTASGLAMPRSTPVRLLSTSALLMVACVPAALATRLFPETATLTSAVYVLVLMPLVSLLLGFVRATRLQQQEIDQNVSGIVEETRWWISRTRMVRWWQGLALARALHGPVQSAIHVASQRLRVALDSDTATPTLVEAVLDDVRRTLPDVVLPPSTSVDIAAELEALAAAWQPMVLVDFSVADAVADRVYADIVCAEIAADVVGEAVSNAARHGGARNVQIALESTIDTTVSIRVTDDGDGDSWAVAAANRAAHVGLGTTQLDTCALSWNYIVLAGANELRVELPLLNAE